MGVSALYVRGGFHAMHGQAGISTRIAGGRLQVSISGQAVVFVVRTLRWSPISVAGKLTYIAFFLAQVRSWVDL